MSKVGIVVIGRNEGERLRLCLASLEASSAPIVYVDSGSSDGSDAWARSRGASVVALDTETPFTAARARNAGFARLISMHPDISFVQFVDGDCEVVKGWIDRASHELEADERLAVVCGRRRERFRERSIYNRLADIEWDTPVGPAQSCGGDAMMRARAFERAGGFNGAVIAGEEPELCARIRGLGFTVLRVDAEMTLHDAAMTRFGQWWRRAVRAGHCFAEGFALHGAAPEHLWRRKNASILAWALFIPMTALVGAAPTSGWSLLLFALYPASVYRYYRKNLRGGLSPRDAWAWAAFCMLSNFPHLVGQATYVWSRLRRRQPRIIEYKGAS